MNLLEQVHERYVFDRRIRSLCRHLVDCLPPESRVLDVGCGDGSLTSLIKSQRPDLTLEGIETMVRGSPAIPVKAFDGTRIPYGDSSVDMVMFVDVLHHAADPLALLREAVRVAKQGIVIKDHTRQGWLAGSTLRLMDWVGNARHGVALPYRYWTTSQWHEAFQQCGVSVVTWRTHLALYPWPVSLVFDRSLHVLVRLALPSRRVSPGRGGGVDLADDVR